MNGVIHTILYYKLNYLKLIDFIFITSLTKPIMYREDRT